MMQELFHLTWDGLVSLGEGNYFESHHHYRGIGTGISYMIYISVYHTFVKVMSVSMLYSRLNNQE